MIKDVVIRAYNLAEEKYKGQVRKHTNIPYFTHPKHVARIVEKLTHNPLLVAVALLHDVIEDTDITKLELEERFGEKITNLVLELTNSKEERAGRIKKEYMYSKFRSLSLDTLLIKLVDRYHNLLFLERDCSHTDEGIAFIKYYVDNTKFIIKDLNIDFLRQGKILNQNHLYLIDQIETILKFMGLLYD